MKDVMYKELRGQSSASPTLLGGFFGLLHRLRRLHHCRHWTVLVSGAQAMRCCRPKPGEANTLLCSRGCWMLMRLSDMLMLRSSRRS